MSLTEGTEAQGFDLNSLLRNSDQIAILLPQESFMELNQLSSQIIKAAINVHRKLGPGLLEFYPVK